MHSVILTIRRYKCIFTAELRASYWYILLLYTVMRRRKLIRAARGPGRRSNSFSSSRKVIMTLNLSRSLKMGRGQVKMKKKYKQHLRW